jgi:formylglycine-generating enzyme required for sulfatase activity
MVLSGTAIAQVDPLSGIDFVTVGAVGNAPYQGPSGNVVGRGRVDYEYRIGRLEVTTAQWVEFMNAALDRPSTDRIPHVFAPDTWGARGVSAQNGGRRWEATPAGAMLPASAIDWRTCAIYCNWLHHGKSLDRSAFLSGAYEVSTFAYIGDTSMFTDQLTRSPGARYWIPSLDEWVKAAHYDPSKQNSDGTTGGYWRYGNSSDSPFVLGPPGVLVNGVPATANTGWRSDQFPGYDPFSVPLGAYANVASPWGLLDVAGGTSEWTEDWAQAPDESFPRWRMLEGSSRYYGSFSGDRVDRSHAGRDPTDFNEENGFRIAASVPAPGVSLGIALLGCTLLRRRWQ